MPSWQSRFPKSAFSSSYLLRLADISFYHAHTFSTASFLYSVECSQLSSLKQLHHRPCSGGFKRGAVPPLLAHIFSNSRFFRVKGIYFVVRICDKRGRNWYIVFRPPSKFLDPPLYYRLQLQSTQGVRYIVSAASSSCIIYKLKHYYVGSPI